MEGAGNRCHPPEVAPDILHHSWLPSGEMFSCKRRMKLETKCGKCEICQFLPFKSSPAKQGTEKVYVLRDTCLNKEYPVSPS